MDYLITEAVAIKVGQEDDKLRKDAERKAEIEQKRKEAMAELHKHRGGV